MTETDRVEEVKLHHMVSAARMGKDDPKPEEGNCTNKYLKNKRVHQDVAGERERVPSQMPKVGNVWPQS